MTRPPLPTPCLLGLVLLATCGGSTSDAEARFASYDVPAAAEASAPTGAVDSILPMAVALDRFRADLDQVTRLTSGADTRDGLVRAVIDAIEANDTTGFEPLAVGRAEWAWLYFPTSTVAHPPYELPPGLAWFQLQERNRKGVLRALRELGGHGIDLGGYTCTDEPTSEGENKVWAGCRVTLSRDGASPVTLALFGAILERDGRFAILSFANDF